MVKNVIQEQRMKSYFIEAARKMIRSEGVRSISIRSVADYAGYSYATIYNYFRNIKELIFCTANEFVTELDEFIESRNITEEKGRERIKSLTSAYISYFVQYQGIFDLFFIEKMPEISSNQKLSEIVYHYLDNLLMEDWEILAKENKLTGKEVAKITLLHHSFVHSLLLFYMNRRIPSNYKEFMENYESLSEMVLNNCLYKTKLL